MRTKYLLSFSLLLFSFNTYSQNYTGCPTGKQVHYAKSEFGNSSLFLTIAIDSVVTNGSSTELYNFNSYDESGLFSCWHASRVTWLGQKVVINNSGIEYYFNQAGDTITLNTQLTAGANFTLYRFANGDYIQATLLQTAQQTFLTLTDSVKTYALQTYNSTSNPVSHIFNGKEILLSKSFGFVKTYSFKDFPNDTTQLIIAGMDNPAVGVQNLKYTDVFDFDVGDEYHYHYFFPSSLPEYYVGWRIRNVIDKTFSANNDTVTYLLTECLKVEHHNFANINTSFSYDTVQYKYLTGNGSSVVSPINNFTYQLFDTTTVTQMWNPTSGYCTFNYAGDYNNRTTKTVQTYFYFDTTQNCYNTMIGTGVFPILVYAKALGQVFYSDNTCAGGIWGNGCYDSLVYFKKGLETWGTSLGTCTTLLSINAAQNKGSITVSPNPAEDVIEINSHDTFINDHFTIADALGKVVMSDLLTHGSIHKINISSLVQGVYVINIKSGSKNSFVKFIKQ